MGRFVRESTFALTGVCLLPNSSILATPHNGLPHPTPPAKLTPQRLEHLLVAPPLIPPLTPPLTVPTADALHLHRKQPSLLALSAASAAAAEAASSDDDAPMSDDGYDIDEMRLLSTCCC